MCSISTTKSERIINMSLGSIQFVDNFVLGSVVHATAAQSPTVGLKARKCVLELCRFTAPFLASDRTYSTVPLDQGAYEVDRRCLAPRLTANCSITLFTKWGPWSETHLST
eukprot:IDg9742t1